MTDELRARLIDRFEGWELVDFLSIPTEDVIERFDDFIQEHMRDVEELCGLRSDED